MATASALLRSSQTSLLRAAFAMNTTPILTFAYLLSTEVSIDAPCYAVHDVAWVIIGFWVPSDTDVAPASTVTKRRTVAVAVDYFTLLVTADGLVTSPVSSGAGGVRVTFLPSEWGPALVCGSDLFNFVLTPARVVGCTAFALLVYDAVVKAAGAAVSGVVGLFFCVSCSWSVLALVATSAFGGGTAVAATVTTPSCNLSTLILLATVLLLWWQFGFGALQ